MISQKEFIDSLVGEIQIIRHLGTKITPDMLAYRPHEKQRTMLELMQYLGHIFDTGVSLNIAGNMGAYKELTENLPVVTLENFDTTMAAQAEAIHQKLAGLSEESLNEEIEIFGRKMKRSMHMFGVLRWAAAYKMQLFLYIKANGNHDIGTMNLWAGMDAAPKE
jgi:hypothetical protein